MPEPRIRRFPLEIFGFPYSDIGEIATKTRTDQFCPYLNGECKKPRKSEPHIKVGTCSVGYKGNSSADFVPVIICPHRLELPVIFPAIKRIYFPDIDDKTEKLIWLPELQLGTTLGYADYTIAKVDKELFEKGELRVFDFACVELQAAGTTGSPYEAVLEHRRDGKFSKDTYKYGINWANEFAKTMMQQAYKKGQLFSLWRKKLIFAIQDIGLQYLEAAYDTSGLHEHNELDPIHFCTFNMVWNEGTKKWDLEYIRHVSTDLEGIRKILGGTAGGDFPTQEQFLERFEKKLKAKSRLK